MRINKYLAQKGVSTRKEADILIGRGLIRINGRPAVLGDKVEKTDKVEVIGQTEKKYVYYAYNKPVGVVTNPEEGQKSISKILKIKDKVFPVGRLDKESHGLIILTNDGRITDRLLNPKNIHDKEYLVTVDKHINDHFIRQFTSGVNIEGYKTKKCVATKTDDKDFTVQLTEGKRHQIRRMCAALGYQVQKLERIRVMNIKLDNLKAGEQRLLGGKELTEFLLRLGLAEGGVI